MNSEYQKIKERFQELMVEKRLKEEELEKEEEDRSRLETRLADALDGRTVLQKVAKMTQDKLGIRMASLVSMALDAVFPDDPYIYDLEFVERRGKTECDVTFQKAGKGLDPMISSGGGPKDVGAFMARPAAWSLRKDKRPLIFADEPFKYLHSPVYQRNCSDVLRAVSGELGLQMIIVSDQADLDGDNIIRL